MFDCTLVECTLMQALERTSVPRSTILSPTSRDNCRLKIRRWKSLLTFCQTVLYKFKSSETRDVAMMFLQNLPPVYKDVMKLDFDGNYSYMGMQLSQFSFPFAVQS
uniref:Uncharacterized protein n=1 Tax=Spongospora subterranea TaxID=70186 RepID=A0A0H5QKP2_9EUKA|eukprot:CRZ02197.1 hypothetical protein [Spongospora subterranea]